ncbi:MAG: restriction endonuclease subunit S [Flavobacterium sp.]|nr:restriction endonuclease subunit S [Flavobacterium sp.]
MGRGRKPISNFNGSEWETVFYNSVGTYVQYINIQLSKEYSLEPLSNHLKIVGGYAFKTAEYKNQGIPIIRISDFNNEQIVLKDVVYYQDAKELDKYQLIEGDIIIALTGGTIAKLAIVQAGLGKIYLNQRVGKFQALKPEEFEVEYIYWLARSIQSIIKNLAWGAAIPNVSPKQIEELKFPFPTKDIQRGIIDFLNDLKNNNLKEDKIYFDEIIENEIVTLQEKQLTTSSISTELTHQLTLVKKLRQQLLQDAVQGKLVEQNKKDEPASELLKKIKAEKEKLIAEKKIKKEKELPPIKPEEIPFEIPENWVCCRLGDSVILKRGKSKHRPRNDVRLFEGGVYPFIQTGDVARSKTNGFLIETINGFYNDFGLSQSLMQKKGTLCITIAANIAECGFLGFDACAPDSIVCLNAIDQIIEKYCFYYIIQAREDIEKYAPATAQKNINLEILNSLLIPLPPLAEQNRIVQKLDELMQSCNELEASIKQSESQNSTLLQQVLREALRKEN